MRKQGSMRMAGLVGFGLLTMAAAATAQRATREIVADEVKTKKLVVFDSAGEPRAIITTTDATGDVAITLHGSDRRTNVALSLRRNGSAMLVFYDRTQARVTLALDSQRGGTLLLTDARGKTAKMLTEVGVGGCAPPRPSWVLSHLFILTFDEDDDLVADGRSFSPGAPRLVPARRLRFSGGGLRLFGGL